MGRTLTALLAFACVGFGSVTHAAPPQSAAAVLEPDVDEVASFYAARSDVPLWFAAAATDARQQLIRLLAKSNVDGLNPKDFEVGQLLLLVRAAEGGDRQSVRRADEALSRAFVQYAQGVQRDPKVGVIYVDEALKPKQTSARELLQAAATAPSLSKFVAQLQWMHPIYAQLRKAIVARTGSEIELNRLALNLERARAIPKFTGRHVLVNAADQRLTMFQEGKPVGEMKVVVGRSNAQTPLINAYIRYAVLNPYWNVPADLAVKLAQNVVREGPAYLKQKGYQVVANAGDNAPLVNPATVDWKGVAAGKASVQMRQLPGPANSMGKVKYMFPNTQGVWLHDTPSREHFAKDERLISSGCVRLQDAWKLGSWLFGRKLQPDGDEPEKRLDLPQPVPVIITYLTAVPDGDRIRVVEDVYGRDTPAFRTPDRPQVSGSRSTSP